MHEAWVWSPASNKTRYGIAHTCTLALGGKQEEEKSKFKVSLSYKLSQFKDSLGYMGWVSLEAPTRSLAQSFQRSLSWAPSS